MGSMNLPGTSDLPMAGRVSVRPTDTGDVLANPGMGWGLICRVGTDAAMLTDMADMESLAGLPGLTTICFCVPWSCVEPQEGRFQWALVDTPAQRWIAQDLQVAFRFVCVDPRLRYATPEWVVKSGAKGSEVAVPGASAPVWRPDVSHPVFLQKLERFLAVAASRYDGDPHVAFVDIASIGAADASAAPVTSDVVRTHLDIYTRHFRQTLLAVSDAALVSIGDDQAVFDTLSAHHMAVRHDSLPIVAGELGTDPTLAVIDRFWLRQPVIVDASQQGDIWVSDVWKHPEYFVKAAERLHAGCVLVGGRKDALACMGEHEARIRNVANSLGYRFQLTAANWPAEISLREPLDFATHWQNTGVAPCCRNAYVTLTLKDADGRMVAVFADAAFNLRKLVPGDAASRHSSCVLMPYLKPGIYEVYVSVGTITGKPVLALPLNANDGQRRYRLGRIVVTH